MKRSTWIIIVIFLAIGLTVGTFAIAEESQPSDFDGVWFGSGKVSNNMTCSGGEIPIGFIVQNGLAISLVEDKRGMFEVKVKKKGKIKFRYKGAAGESAGEGSQATDIVFSGKLGELSGKGNFYFGSGTGCRGKWTVSKK